jgi:tRNA A37 threonylcarbamoyladenosine dehydratase
MSRCERTEILIGEVGLKRLKQAHVSIIGLGGVGGFVAEALARAGVGKITLVDYDVISESNINRQIIALYSTLGQVKTAVTAQRLRDIQPDIAIREHNFFVRPENVEEVVLDARYDFIADCIDSIACKAALIAACQQAEVPFISALGAGGRLDPAAIRLLFNLNQSRNCPLARELRYALKQHGTSLHFPFVYSEEVPIKALPHQAVEGPAGRPRAVNGVIAYLPALIGLWQASFIVRSLLK